MTAICNHFSTAARQWSLPPADRRAWRAWPAACLAWSRLVMTGMLQRRMPHQDLAHQRVFMARPTTHSHRGASVACLDAGTCRRPISPGLPYWHSAAVLATRGLQLAARSSSQLAACNYELISPAVNSHPEARSHLLVSHRHLLASAQIQFGVAKMFPYMDLSPWHRTSSTAVGQSPVMAIFFFQEFEQSKAALDLSQTSRLCRRGRYNAEPRINIRYCDTKVQTS